jgi:type II secretory pathway predicted ATPase ExeA
MFLEFFGLREQPFGMTPDPAYLYASRTHSDALASLSLGIADNRGFLALIAQPGMGKTTLLYRLLEELRNTTRTVLVFQTLCNSREFIEYILRDLGVDIGGMGLVAMHGKLNEILFEELLAGKRFLLVVDEAQNLDDSVLETVRMLSNFETHNTKLLQIVLAGQPRLAAKLAQPRLSQLRQRVAVLSRLEPFTVVETGLYIEHRLKVAGYSGEPIFDPAAVTRIARESCGIPRNINNLCYQSLLLCHAGEVRTVTAEIVQLAAARLDLDWDLDAHPDTVSLVSEPLKVVDFAAAPVAPRLVASDPPAKVSALSPAPIPAPNAAKVGRKKSFLTYDPGRNIRTPRWSARSAILAALILSGTLLLAILGRSESIRGIRPAILGNSSSALFKQTIAGQTAGASTSYDAAPQDTGNGLVITVAAGPQQTVKDLSLRYAGYFDRALSEKIFLLNPGLKDPDHLETGQLIRIPLAPGAIRKENDTADAPAPAEPVSSGGLFTRFSALLRERK